MSFKLVHTWLIAAALLLSGKVYATSDSSFKSLEKWMQAYQAQLESVSDLNQEIEIPDSWDQEPAIKLLDYSYFKITNDLQCYIFTRRKFKIQDETFLKSISSSLESAGDEVLEVTVYHNNGTKKKYTPEEAVADELTVVLPDGQTIKEVVRRRFSLPGLGIGDVVQVDLAQKTNLKEKWEDRRQKSDVYVRYLNQSIPLLVTRIEYEIANSAVLNWRSLASAPELQYIGQDTSGSKYRFDDRLREARKIEAFSAHNFESPCIKFAFLAAKTDKKLIEMNSRSDFKEAFSKEDVCRMANSMYSDFALSNSEFYLAFDKNLSAYYRQKGHFIARKFLKDYKLYYVNHARENSLNQNLHFVSMLSRVLRKYKVDFEYVVSTPKENGNLNDVISLKELHWAIKLTDSKDLYSFTNYFSQANEISPNLERQSALVIKPRKSKSKVIDRLPFGEGTNGQVIGHQEEYTWEIIPGDTSASVYLRHLYTGQMKDDVADNIPSALYIDQILEDNYYLKESPFIYESLFSEKIIEDLDLSYRTNSAWENNVLKLLYEQRLKENGLQVNQYHNLNFSGSEGVFNFSSVQIVESFKAHGLFQKLSDVKSVFQLSQVLPNLAQSGWEDSTRNSGIYIGNQQKFTSSILLKTKKQEDKFSYTLRDTVFLNNIGTIEVTLKKEQPSSGNKPIERPSLLEKKDSLNRVFSELWDRDLNLAISSGNGAVDILHKIDSVKKAREGYNQLPETENNLLQIKIRIEFSKSHYSPADWGAFQDFIRFYEQLQSATIQISEE